MANQIKAPINYPIIAGGKIVSGGSVIFGQPNVKPDPDNPSTLKAIYLDAALTQQAENPQGISSDGVFDQSDTGILYGPSDTVYSIVILGANKKQLSYIPEYDLSDANSAAAAQDSAAQAESAASNAIAAKDLTEALYTDFTNRYFGSYSSDPSVDDLGNPPNEGSIYFNTVSDVFLTWNGSTWANYFPSNPNGLMVTATGTTTPRSLADSGADEVNVKQFNDDIIAARDFCRSNNKTLFIPAGEYNMPSELDISGVRIRGERSGFNDGTVLVFDRSYDGLIQASNSAGDITYHIENLVIKEARWGLKMNYSVGSTIKNVAIINSDNGMQVGASGTLGPLFNYFENLWVDVDGEGLSLGGDDFCNANQFNTCFIRGHANAGRINAGGLGALSNTFTNVEFRGDNLGVIFGSSKSTQFYGCYFECDAPAIKIAGFSQDIRLDSCVYGTLVNTNLEGINSFIWHESGAASVKISGGYVTLGKVDGTQDNLRFIHSDAPTFLKYEDSLGLDTEILASGWSIYGAGLPTARFSVKYQGSYTPAWSGQGGTQPVLGDGTIEGFYTLNSNECSVYIELTMGSTTTFGSGGFLFSLPITSTRERLGAVLHFESGVGFDSGVSKVNASSSQVACYPSNGNITSNISPWTWSAGDKISINISYPII